ncbi:hypothetical protein HanPSC8_Chr08g0314871 [Helianthus annuus]|nr:hypothetical protein HanPSC8_Chr08g0314871 [Helianthus annuus]
MGKKMGVVVLIVIAFLLIISSSNALSKTGNSAKTRIRANGKRSHLPPKMFKHG